jgi:hypothetical protein
MNREQFTFCAEIKWETENAYLLTDGVNEFWIPKSQVTEKEHISGSDYEITIPEWLAIDKEII